MVHMAGGNPMEQMMANAPVRRNSLYDDQWDAETRRKLGIRLTARLEIPITNKHDQAKFADLLRGLAHRMEVIANDTSQTELGAYLAFSAAMDETKRKMDLAGGIKRKTMRR